ncbi:hypothetical protein [Effusibacillus lacus]|nr:hypothetical protein [Effusibacillus lacus]
MAETHKLKLGDPYDPETDIGPMISEKKAAGARKGRSMQLRK